MWRKPHELWAGGAPLGLVPIHVSVLSAGMIL